MATTTDKTWPVIEIFGPTVQGEGVDQGVMCHFIRFGGCDFRCSWCDTPYAVVPKEVRENATKMTAHEIVNKLDSMPRVAWVILSGGNPAMHDLTELLMELRRAGYLVAVETQGSKWKHWLTAVDRLCVSPKPPSSGMVNDKHAHQLAEFMHNAYDARSLQCRSRDWMFLKVVCFNEEDIEFAQMMRRAYGDMPLYLSAGNDAGRTVSQPTREDHRGIPEVREDLLDTAAWLIQEAMNRDDLRLGHDVFIQTQFHTAVWGNGQGF